MTLMLTVRIIHKTKSDDNLSGSVSQSFLTMCTGWITDFNLVSKVIQAGTAAQ